MSTLSHDYVNKLDENYCGLCGTIHETGTCHMVQNAENLAEYRAMLMEVTNEESIEIRVRALFGDCLYLRSLFMQREAIQAIDEKLLKTGKLDLIKGQPVFLSDKPKKRKKPYESDQGENTTEHAKKAKKPRKPRQPRNITEFQISSWKPLVPKDVTPANASTPTFSTIPPLLPTVGLTTTASGSKGPGSSFSMDPLQPVKVSTFSAIASTNHNLCPLCGEPKHELRDCPIPKGGVKK